VNWAPLDLEPAEKKSPRVVQGSGLGLKRTAKKSHEKSGFQGSKLERRIFRLPNFGFFGDL